MIDSSLFNLDRLVDELLYTLSGNVNHWLSGVEIIPDYMPPFPRSDTRPACVVRYKKSFLRHSCGPWQGYFWDVYGDDFFSPERALIAVANAPVPPCALRPEVWKVPAQSPAHDQQQAEKAGK